MLTLLKKRQDRAAAKAALENPTEEIQDQVADGSTIVPSTSPSDPLAGKPWDEIQRILAVDLELVRTLASFEEKNAFRKELIKKYKAQVEHLLSSHKNLEGLELIWWFYLWQIDCGLLPLVHDDFKAAVMRGLNTPQKWNTNATTAYCDIIFKYSHKAHAEKSLFNTQYLSSAIADIVEGKIAINAPLKVKMFRLAGDLLDESGHKKEALSLFEAVMQMDPNKGGRKKRVKDLSEELNHEQE
ncbi:phage terminase small subunit [Aliivibrio logei]|jgi:hypothetical protein|uniref:Uncharacterized protein n=1 Tax=Aliivibrio logei TaxID=688 RepID=A0A1B9NTG2_ALILO|nr:phage terminase small subunit [Aliivibrio logei]OCH16988.1 hypothetical protein A6E04_19215 [Aliivibrio logei]